MPKYFNKKNLAVFFILLALFTLVIVTGAFSHVRNSIADKLYGNGKALENIVVVAIDDESINKIGRWPWDRSVFAQILDKTKEAKAVGMDLSFFESSANDSALKINLESIDNVILASEINGGIFYKPIFNSDNGYVNLATDNDGVTRSVEARLRKDTLPFAFSIYEKGFGEKISSKKEAYYINFISSSNGFQKISAYDLLNGGYDLKNRIVLIGATAPDLHDNYFVPTSNGIPMPGVEIHANILQNLILDNFLVKQGKFGVFVFVLLSGAFGMFLLSRLKVYYIIIFCLLILFSYWLSAAYIFSHFNYIIDLFLPSFAFLAFTGTGIGINYLEEKKHSAYLKDAFGKYISKDLLKEILDKKKELKLGGDKRDITIFFSDIRGFTSISEKLSAEKLVAFINEYLTEMTKIILKNKGTVDKFIGDAIMAFWNAPLIEKNHAYLACKSAIEQCNALKEMQKKWAEKKMPEINIGCGINTGEAVIGNMGSEDRFDYTAMGDSVNLASRLESLTKQYGVNIIISESTYGIVKDEFKCRKLDLVKVKGKKIPIMVYELCVEHDLDFVKQFEKGLGFYFKGKFSSAVKEFEKALRLKKGETSCILFIERCRVFMKKSPGKKWDGAFEMKSK